MAGSDGKSRKIGLQTRRMTTSYWKFHKCIVPKGQKWYPDIVFRKREPLRFIWISPLYPYLVQMYDSNWGHAWNRRLKEFGRMIFCSWHPPERYPNIGFDSLSTVWKAWESLPLRQSNVFSCKVQFVLAVAAKPHGQQEICFDFQGDTGMTIQSPFKRYKSRSCNLWWLCLMFVVRFQWYIHGISSPLYLGTLGFQWFPTNQIIHNGANMQ